MKTMCVVIAMCAVLVATSSVAKADIVMLGATPTAAFLNLGGQGFGADPRMLTLQTTGIETGNETPIDVEHGDAINGADKSTTPLLSALLWKTGADVGIGFNSGQTGNSGITLQSLSLTIYDTSFNAVHTFTLASPVQFSATDLGLQQGNGNAVFAFGLDATQEALFDSLFATHQNYYAGLGASLGCAGTASATCQPSNDGPDSFLGFDRTSPTTPLPDGGMTVMLLGGALVGLESLRRRFRA